MFISKINVDLNNNSNYVGFADAGYFHSKIENCFKGDREHPLWTIIGSDIIMVSHREPDIPITFGKSQTKKYDLQIPEGSILHYRITANPTKKINGKRVPLNVNKTKKYPYSVIDWLKERLNSNGADVLTMDITEHKNINAKGGKVKVFAVTYEGSLVVKDWNKFKIILENGIGHAKTYGCGLLLVRR